MAGSSVRGFINKVMIICDLEAEMERKNMLVSDAQIKLWVRATNRIARAAYNRGYVKGRKKGLSS